LYHHAWCTALETTAANVVAIGRIGRSRWQIEHAQCKVQTKHGDALEHHDGHGQQTLAMVFDLLTLWAFIAPMMVERGDRVYQRCLATPSRRERWPTRRTAMPMMRVNAGADGLLLYLDEAGPRPSRAWVQAGTSLERPMANPGVMQRAS
jgi:hypothetical protein